MLYDNRIDISEGIDFNKTSESNECNICHYWYFLQKGFKFQPDVCNSCHDILMMSINLSDIAILNPPSTDYRIISGIRKSEAVNLLQNVKHKNLFSHIKMGKEISKFDVIEIKKHKFY